MASQSNQSSIVKWIDRRLPVFTFIEHSLKDYPTPKNLNYWWNYGSLAGVLLVILMASGIFLAMEYNPDSTKAFDSVERIMRDVNYGWLIRSIHVNGGSIFFLVVYIHLFRGMYYGSYKSPRELLWWLGVIILVLMMATAFMGYLLPWGQMSFWAATVITKLFEAIPWFGESIMQWLRGGYAVDNATLTRFFSLHFLLPFVIVAVVMLHLVALHTTKSNNPIGIDPKGPQDTIPFHPYYTVKDYYGMGIMLIVFAVFVFFAPHFFAVTANFEPANPMMTPLEVVPEWYFLPFYTILRAVPDNFIGDWIGFVLIDAKRAGVIAFAASIMIFFALPFLDTSPVRSSRFRPIYKWFFWIFVLNCVVLTWLGAKPPEGNYKVIGQITTAWYFIHFLVILPVLGKLERPLPLPKSISEPVLKGGGAAPAGAAAKPMGRV